MKYTYPEDLYTDVRIENVFETSITYSMDEIKECNEMSYSGAFIRIYDGKRWYCSSVSDISDIQSKIDTLSKLTDKNPKIAENKIYGKLLPHKDKCIVYSENNVSKIDLAEKAKMVLELSSAPKQNKLINSWDCFYRDKYVLKEFYSSKGADLNFDIQYCDTGCWFALSEMKKNIRGSYRKQSKEYFTDISEIKKSIEEEINVYRDFMLNAEPIKPGKYTVIFGPYAAGTFAHECFGHKSESDYLMNEEARKNWVLGKKISIDGLSIIDNGEIIMPYDDEGNKTQATYLIKNGILSGQLHNSNSAAFFDMEPTGNARAMTYEFEPIVRMTATYIDAGNSNKTLKQLIEETDEGIFIENIYQGNSSTTFTITPRICYYINDGKICKPILVSSVSANIWEALMNVSDIANEFVLNDGYCGKIDQSGLYTLSGGASIKVKEMGVR